MYKRQVLVGNLVSFRASVNATWRSSMEVGVRVEAEDVPSGELHQTSTAYLTMVALNDDGRPIAVPPIAPATDAERRREREAQLRRDNRLAERGQIVQERASSTGAAGSRGMRNQSTR